MTLRRLSVSDPAFLCPDCGIMLIGGFSTACKVDIDRLGEDFLTRVAVLLTLMIECPRVNAWGGGFFRIGLRTFSTIRLDNRPAYVATTSQWLGNRRRVPCRSVYRESLHPGWDA